MDNWASIEHMDNAVMMYMLYIDKYWLYVSKPKHSTAEYVSQNVMKTELTLAASCDPVWLGTGLFTKSCLTRREDRIQAKEK